MSRRIPFLWKAIIALLGLIICVVLIWNLMTYVDASERVVKQSVLGDLSVYEEPGYKPQLWAKLTRYPRAKMFDFKLRQPITNDKGKVIEDDSLCFKIRFNDNGQGKICGTMVIQPPSGNDLIILHKEFPGMDAVINGLVEPTIRKAVYQTGPLMSSRESASERRSELQEFIEEQARIGIYKKVTHEEKIDDPGAPMVKDPETGKMVYSKKLVKISEPVMKDGVPVIQEESALTKFKVKFINFAIQDVIYSASVREQIEAQRQREVAIQTAIAQAKLAEQNAKTAKANETAEVAKMRAEMEVEKIKEVTQAEKTRDVARLNLEAAQLEAQAVIEKGKAEAEARRLKMNADGALEQRLKAKVEINRNYAIALSKAQPGALVPNFVMGGNGSARGGTATDLIQLLTAQAASEVNEKFKVEK